MARCRAGSAERLGADPARLTEATGHLAAARRWDARDPEVLRIADDLATALERRGEEAAGQGDDAAAYSAWRDALTADPTRAALRRRTETVRDRLAASEAEAEP
jgi:hypothetical protein